LATVLTKNAIIKYKTGGKFIRIAIDIDHVIGKKFKQTLLYHNRTMAGVLRSAIEEFITDNPIPPL